MKHTENSSNSLFLDRNGNSTNQFLSISITTSTGEQPVYSVYSVPGTAMM